ncbi:MAG TPA: 50S ribosomal protein L9, partial [Alphaproteobacteria bacterium]|nr:50S ribosomal protein L9 [Alphaproteobacteria bacterium]
MEVILLERIEKLGQMGDVVHVKPGFARNYLLPKAKALRSNKENMALFEAQKAQLEAANLKRREEAEQIAAKMEGLNLVIIRQAAETGQLYGSVTGRDVRDAIREAGYNIERRQVVLDQPLKEIGSYSVRIVLHPDVSRQVGITVAR